MEKVTVLTDTLSVSPQPSVQDLSEIAAQGFEVVVCNRPDQEAEGQPSMDDMAAAAEALGLKFVRYPVNPANFPGSDLQGLAKVFDGGERVFAYCRTGTRCTNLWVLTRGAGERDAAQSHAKALGFDLSMSEGL